MRMSASDASERGLEWLIRFAGTFSGGFPAVEEWQIKAVLEHEVKSLDAKVSIEILFDHGTPGRLGADTVGRTPGGRDIA